jgi:hypothetical protein
VSSAQFRWSRNQSALPEEEQLEFDEALDGLDFGLFTSRPGSRELVRQSTPVVWIGLVALWPELLSVFLRTLWCVPILEDGQAVSRLLPDPDILCWSPEHMPAAGIGMVGLVVWCLGIPLALASRLFTLEDMRTPNSYRKYGYFIQGFEHDFWWWDIVVKRADVGLMMVITYTSIVQDPEAKLSLFPVFSGLQLGLAAWFKPFSNDQAQVLDILEVTLCTVRFLLFSSVASFLILNLSEPATYGSAALLFAALLAASAYLLVHVLAQFLRDASMSSDPGSQAQKKEGSRGLVKMAGARDLRARPTNAHSL